VAAKFSIMIRGRYLCSSSPGLTRRNLFWKKCLSASTPLKNL